MNTAWLGASGPVPGPTFPVGGTDRFELLLPAGNTWRSRQSEASTPAVRLHSGQVVRQLFALVQHGLAVSRQFHSALETRESDWSRLKSPGFSLRPGPQVLPKQSRSQVFVRFATYVACYSLQTVAQTDFSLRVMVRDATYACALFAQPVANEAPGPNRPGNRSPIPIKHRDRIA
jgi:hypothetical protein